MNPTLLSLRWQLDHLSTQTSPSIFGVPRQLREVNDKAYEPGAIAIGPYHHRKGHLIDKEQLKLRFLQSLLQRKPAGEDERYTSAMIEVEQEARDCYEAPIFLDSVEFTGMLVLDGCFIIEVMQRYIDNDLTLLPRSFIRSVQEDLILLENQIPFFVLCKLFDLIHGPNQHHKLMEHIVFFYNWAFQENIYFFRRMRINSEEVKHILDLMYTINCVPSLDDKRTPTQFFIRTADSLIIPSAEELEDAYVKFQKKERMWNTHTTLFEVDFNNGIMAMRTLRIDDWTEKLLRNLIAHEQCFGEETLTPIADYAILLDCLINSSTDVEILCRRGIIQNMVGSNQVVADIVNRLTRSVSLNRQNNFIYADTFHRINTHHKKTWNRVKAFLHQKYFSSPLAFMKLCAAILVFCQIVFYLLT